MVINVRARNDEDKLERRQAILDAAADLWKETSYADFTMTAVPERAGIVKGFATLRVTLRVCNFLKHPPETRNAAKSRRMRALGWRGRRGLNPRRPA